MGILVTVILRLVISNLILMEESDRFKKPVVYSDAFIINKIMHGEVMTNL